MQPRDNRDRRLTRRTVQLFAGLILYGVSMALTIQSALGLNPWDVFHQGLAEATGISFGWVVILVGIPVLLLWIPLRQRPGFGTVANLVVVGFAVDGALAVLPEGGTIPARVGYLVGGILLNGLATGLYIGSRFGPGPRDGLMTGVVGRFPRLSIRLVRTSIEVLVLIVGFFLGGTVGIGTIAYALAIGPLAQLFLPLCTVRTGDARPALAH
ncbi:Uncharacterized membrane protein YczE [Paractinoplanes atraurantiacus]|uniref:Uncharacterized membrane protein YczE n=2 Tax=Paractinoplanes atraurantiacus TaxID=1036182 RepID=A0A285ISP1_9ACTN|nr:Uncharacterized membrane protein YczE [Actinoplanes atraurantiacus]